MKTVVVTGSDGAVHQVEHAAREVDADEGEVKEGQE